MSRPPGAEGPERSARDATLDEVLRALHAHAKAHWMPHVSSPLALALFTAESCAGKGAGKAVQAKRDCVTAVGVWQCTHAQQRHALI